MVLHYLYFHSSTTAALFFLVLTLIFQDYLSGLNIADIGCGGGILTFPMARLGANVEAVDASHDVIASVEEAENCFHHENCGSGKATFTCSSVEDFATKNAGSKVHELIDSYSLPEINLSDTAAFAYASLFFQIKIANLSSLLLLSLHLKYVLPCNISINFQCHMMFNINSRRRNVNFYTTVLYRLYK